MATRRGMLGGTLLLLAACAPEPDRPNSFSPDDQRQLNEAADMLDANSLSPATVAAKESPRP